MGDKYIIELGEKERAYKTVDSDGWPMIMLLTPTPYTEPDMEQVRKEAYEDGYENGFIAGHLKAEKSGQSFYEDGYQRGLNDAWEAARKIVLPGDVSGIYLADLEEIFDRSSLQDVIKDYSASECIEKIRQYEQGKEEQIQVGDEVNLKCGVSPAIYMQGTNGSDEIYLLFNDGSCGIHDRDEIECKTGRHFPEIAEVLQKMKES